MAKKLYFCCCVIVFALYIFVSALPASGEPLKVEAALESQEVFLGETFIFQIQVSGSNRPQRPKLRGLNDFKVAFQGGRQNSSNSISIINGRMTRETKRGYIFSYQLTPQRTGSLTIPPIKVQVDGQTLTTRAVQVSVQKPVESADFKLRVKLSKSDCYVGEPLILTTIWYLGSDVRSMDFSLPVLSNKNDFDFADIDIDTSGSGKFYRIPLTGGEVIAWKGRGRLNGKDYATLSFKKVLFPKKAGQFKIKPALVSCEALSGHRRGRNDFFSDFFNNSREVYRKVVIPSNSLSLNVLELPEAGKHPDFAGHIGQYTLTAQADPRDVSVGDPITLKITLSGPSYLEHIRLPALANQPALQDRFKIPEERAVGEIKDQGKVFTQTIRPLNADIKEIGPLELSYFDPQSGQYKIARTRAIPLKVKTTRIVTALDAEGLEVSPAVIKNEIQTWSKGIAYNYEGPRVLEKDLADPLIFFNSRAGISLLSLPPALYFLLLLGTAMIRRRQSDPLAVRVRKAYPLLVKSLNHDNITDAHILEALCTFLGDKLRMSAAALTYNDVVQPLQTKGVDQQTLEELKIIFNQCEAGRYAGVLSSGNTHDLRQQTLALTKKLKIED